MAAPDPIGTALLTEHLTYTPISIIDDIINAVNDLLYGACKDVEDYLHSSAPSALGYLPPPGEFAETDDDGRELFSDKAQDEIQNGVHQLEMLLENGVDRSFDGFELFVLRNIFTIPPELRDWVRLRHHEGLDLTKIDDSQTRITPQSITRLRRQLRETVAFKLHLQNDVTRNDQIITYLKSILHSTAGSFTSAHPLAFLGSPSPSAQAIKPVPETAAFAIEQIKTLRQMVARLQASSEHVVRDAKDMANGSAMDVDVDPNGRATYVERMTRRYLENVRGLQFTQDGSLKNGEGDLGEANRSEAEAATLEEFVDKLGKHSNSNGEK